MNGLTVLQILSIITVSAFDSKLYCQSLHRLKMIKEDQNDLINGCLAFVNHYCVCLSFRKLYSIITLTYMIKEDQNYRINGCLACQSLQCLPPIPNAIFNYYIDLMIKEGQNNRINGCLAFVNHYCVCFLFQKLYSIIILTYMIKEDQNYKINGCLDIVNP